MSRIGKLPVAVPAGVKVNFNEGILTVEGPKGKLTQAIHGDMILDITAGEIVVKRPSDQKQHKALHGLTRSLIANMMTGVTVGFTKELEISEGGYRAQKKGKEIVMNLGYSHDVIYTEPNGITIDVPTPNKLVVTGADKQQVGQVAAELKAKRVPDPYHHKGIKYAGERLRTKAGKAGK